MHGCLSAVAQFSVALTIIHLFIDLPFHLRLPRWLLARAPPVTLYVHLLIYVFTYLISHTHVPSIGPPVIIFVSAGSSAGLRNRVGYSPCLQTVRIPFRNENNCIRIIYLFIPPGSSKSARHQWSYRALHLFMYFSVAGWMPLHRKCRGLLAHLFIYWFICPSKASSYQPADVPCPLYLFIDLCVPGNGKWAWHH